MHARVLKALLLGALAVPAMAVAADAQAPTAAPQEIARVPGAVTGDALNGVVIWSSRSASARGRYVLRVAEAGRVRSLHVASRRVPFDVNLGVNESGRMVATYSRCRSELGVPGVVGDDRPFYRAAVGCRLRQIPVAGGVEKPIDVRVPHGESLYFPALWGDRVAFAATRHPGSDKHDPLPAVYTARIGGRPHAVGRGSVVAASDELPAPGVTGVDLRDGLVAFGWRRRTFGCAPDPNGITEVWTANIDGTGRTRLDQGGCNTPRGDSGRGRNQLAAPVLGAHGATWGATDLYADPATGATRGLVISQRPAPSGPLTQLVADRVGQVLAVGELDDTTSVAFTTQRGRTTVITAVQHG